MSSDQGHEAALENARLSRCWCADTRKRCAYHEGFEDGFDMNANYPREATHEQ